MHWFVTQYWCQVLKYRANDKCNLGIFFSLISVYAIGTSLLKMPICTVVDDNWTTVTDFKSVNIELYLHSAYL